MIWQLKFDIINLNKMVKIQCTAMGPPFSVLFSFILQRPTGHQTCKSYFVGQFVIFSIIFLLFISLYFRQLYDSIEENQLKFLIHDLRLNGLPLIRS